MTDLAAPARRPLSPSRLVPPLVALALFMHMLDATILVTALPALARDFGIAPERAGLGVSAYLLALAALVPAAGWAGERWGARAVLAAALAAFTLASLLCALAPSFPAFVAARILQGGAAALMAPVGRMLVLGHAPKAELMRAIATITWPALLAPVAGPVVGAVITERWGWEWVFLVNLPLGVLAVALVLLLVPPSPPAARRPFDRRGFLLLSGGLVAGAGGIEALAARGDPLVAGGALALGLGLGLAARAHLARAPHPLLDLSVLAVPSFRLATMAAGTAGRAAINAVPFLLPLLVQVGWGRGPLESGRLLLAYFLANLGAKGLTSPILRRWGFRRVAVANGLVAAAGVAALGLVPAATPEPLLLALLLVAGAARSIQFTTLNTLAFAEVEAPARAASTTLSTLSQQVAQLLGVAIPVLLIGLLGAARGAAEAGGPEIRLALLGMGALGAVAALRLLALAPGTGREVTGAPA